MSSPSLIPPQRDRFELPRETCYLNAAYMGPMPTAAIAAGQDSYARKGQPWHYSVQADFFDAPPGAVLYDQGHWPQPHPLCLPHKRAASCGHRRERRLNSRRRTILMTRLI